jgi:hypothetical protein
VPNESYGETGSGSYAGAFSLNVADQSENGLPVKVFAATEKVRHKSESPCEL